ncbi:ABC transporter permease [Colwelliaceae bacterium 6441]
MNILLLVWHNSMRKKSRFLLTCLSVAVAFFLFTSLAAINNALDINVSTNNQFRLMTNHKVSITRSLPVNYQQKIAALPGVEQVSYASWFGGFFQNEKHQLAMLAVEHNNYFTLFNEYLLSVEQLNSWKNNRVGVVIGEGIASEFGWKVGDKIPLSSSIWMNKEGGFTWDFVVSAIYQTRDSSVDNKRIFFQHAYFDEARAYANYMVSWLSTQIHPSANVDKVSKAIDVLFENSAGSTRTTTEQVFIKEQAQQFVDMAMVIKVVLSAVFFTLLLIVCNTMLQSHRERLNESAMMKALGFSSLTLIIQIFVESLFLLLCGAVFGSALALGLMGEISQQFADFLPGVGLNASHFMIMLLISFIAACFCTLFPAISIKRLSISRTLGGVA